MAYASADLDSGFAIECSWSETSTSVSNNTSNISISGKIWRKTSYNAFSYTGAGSLTVYWHDNKSNKDIAVASIGIDEIGYSVNERSVSGSITVEHLSDGTLSGFAYTHWQKSYNSGYIPPSGNATTGWVALTKIARASAPTMSASSITIPASSGTITVNTNRASSSFTHTITLKVGSTTIATYTGVGASQTINIADIDDAILATIPNATTATVDVSCQTFNGSTSIGTKSTSFTANVGSGAKPTFSNFTFADTNSTTTGITGNNQVMISGKSAIRVTISATDKATAKYSATMAKYTFAIAELSAEQAYSTSQITKDLGSPTVAANELPSGTRDLVVTAIDSRGLSTSATKTVTIVPYQAPVINATATRANGFENTTTVKISGTFSRIEVGGTAKNTVNTSSGVQYRYRQQGSSTWGSWTNKTATVDTSTGKVTVADFTLNLDNQAAFEFEFKITDKLETKTASLTVSVGQPAFYIGADGRVGVGGMPTISKTSGEQGLLDVKGRIFSNGQEITLDNVVLASQTAGTTWVNRTLKDKDGNNINPVTSDPETAGLVYMGYAGFKKQTYNNGYIVLENLTHLFKGRGVDIALTNSNLFMKITLPATGTYVAELYGQLWTNNNSFDYILLIAKKNTVNFARAMAPKPNGAWAFVELTHPTIVANGDTLEWYLSTNGNNFSDGNMQIADSYTYLKIYKVAD